MSFLRPRTASKTCFYCHNTVLVANASSPLQASFSHAGPSNIRPNDFHCPHCGCWNRFGTMGEILGYEPAMSNENLNRDSFSKRGSPDRNHFPSQYSAANDKGLFCRSCTTNQTLLVNLLANYLPDDETDPSYSARLAALPEYKASLQTRYPPVCSACLPGIEAEIARKDAMARTRVLGGALKESRARGTANGPAAIKTGSHLRRIFVIWKARGILWGFTLLCTVASHIAGLLDVHIPALWIPFTPILPFFLFTSIFWTLWDPTYSLRQRASLRGKELRVEGRNTYIKLQLSVWLTRLLFSSLVFYEWKYPDVDSRYTFLPANLISQRTLHGTFLAVELTISLLSYLSIEIRKPVPIRLIDTSASRALTPLPDFTTSSSPTFDNGVSNFNSYRRGSTPGLSSGGSSTSTTTGPTVSEPDLFATLSLSPNPIIANYAASSAVNPIFGKPSLHARLSPNSRQGDQNNFNVFNDDFRDDDDDNNDIVKLKDPSAMDWEPLSPYANRKNPPSQRQVSGSRGSKDDGTWLREQRFFPPEQPTGLETLLMRTRLVDEDNSSLRHHRRNPSSPSLNHHGQPVRWNWTWVYSLSIIPLLLLLLSLWWSGAWRSRTASVPQPHHF